jgi:hypothetical protein
MDVPDHLVFGLRHITKTSPLNLASRLQLLRKPATGERPSLAVQVRSICLTACQCDAPDCSIGAAAEAHGPSFSNSAG